MKKLIFNTIYLFVIISGYSQYVFDTPDTYSTSGIISTISDDFNGDGKPDLAISYNGLIRIFTNTGLGAFTQSSSFATWGYANDFTSADFNGDGKPDIATIDDIGVLLIHTNTGNGSFGSVNVMLGTGNTPSSIASGDLNSDGRADLVITNYDSNTISVYTSTGTFAIQKVYSTGNSPLGVKIRDFTGDGKPDVAVISAGGLLSVFTNTGSGGLSATKDYAIAGSNIDFPTKFAVNDLNADGKMDIVVVGSINSFYVFTNTGNGTFGVRKDYRTTYVTSSVAISDFTGDGKIDIAIGANNSGLLTYTNTIIGNFDTKIEYPIQEQEPTIHNLLSNDFNGDGKADIVASGVSTFYVYLAKKSQIINGFLTPSKIYGDKFSYNAVSSSSLPVSYISSNTSILNIVGNLATATGIGEVTVSDIQAGNATFAGVTLTGVLTVTKANLTVSANNFNRVYGSTNPVFNGLVSGVQNNDIITPIFSTSATTASGVGNYTINANATGVNINNYTITAINSQLTITPKSATVLGFNANKIYGSTNPTLTGTVLGILNNDVITPSFSTTATSLSGVGTFPIVGTVSGADINNYSISTINSQLTITPKPATVLGFDFTRIYGVINPVLTGTVLGIVNNDVITPSFNTTATTLSGIGTFLIVGTAAGANINNYSISTINSQLTITPKPATVLGFDFTRIYGVTNPVLTGTVLGIVNNDMITPSFNTTATTLSGIGTYQIVGTATGANINNYTISTINSQLTITPKPATVLGFSATKVYGTINPILTGTIIGIVNNDPINVTYSTSATSLSHVGTYPINFSITGASLSNYVLTTISGELEIIKSNLTVQGFNATKVYGTINPILTGTILGIVNNDPINITYGTSATLLSDVGTYPILISATGINISNYNIISINSLLIITKQNQIISGTILSSNSYSYGISPTISPNVIASSRLPVNFSITGTAATLSGRNITLKNVGVFTITAFQIGNQNYLPATELIQVVTITKAILNVSLSNNTLLFVEDGIPNVQLEFQGFANGETTLTAQNFVLPTIQIPERIYGMPYVTNATISGASASNYDFVYDGSIIYLGFTKAGRFKTDISAPPYDNDFNDIYWGYLLDPNLIRYWGVSYFFPTLPVGRYIKVNANGSYPNKFWGRVPSGAISGTVYASAAGEVDFTRTPTVSIQGNILINANPYFTMAPTKFGISYLNKFNYSCNDIIQIIGPNLGMTTYLTFNSGLLTTTSFNVISPNVITATVTSAIRSGIVKAYSNSNNINDINSHPFINVRDFTIASTQPDFISSNTELTINGLNLHSVSQMYFQSDGVVNNIAFDYKYSQTMNISDTKLIAQIPSIYNSTLPITLANSCYSMRLFDKTIVTQVSPNKYSDCGQIFTISGNNLGRAIKIIFSNGVRDVFDLTSFVQVNTNTITFRLPLSTISGVKFVKVLTPIGESIINDFSNNSPYSISKISNYTISGYNPLTQPFYFGTSFTISGLGLMNINRVLINSSGTWQNLQISKTNDIVTINSNIINNSNLLFPMYIEDECLEKNILPVSITNTPCASISGIDNGNGFYLQGNNGITISGYGLDQMDYILLEGRTKDWRSKNLRFNADIGNRISNKFVFLSNGAGTLPGFYLDYIGFSIIEIGSNNKCSNYNSHASGFYMIEPPFKKEFIDSDTKNIIFYPNPASDILYCNRKDIVEIEISNLQGKLKKMILLNDGFDNRYINIAEFQHGLYIIKCILSTGEIKREKLIISK